MPTKSKKSTAEKNPKPTKKAPTVRKKEIPSRRERAMANLQSINTAYKKPVMQAAQDLASAHLVRRPTGITSLDLAIAGGLPAGGLTELIGAASVGKDYLINRVIANIQEVYEEDTCICFCMTEGQFDKAYAKMCGVRVAYSPEEIEDIEESIKRKLTPEERSDAVHQVGEIHEVFAHNAEQLLEIAAQNIESNIYQVVVINSIGALLTKAEEEADGGIEAKHYGGAAMAITSFCHRLHMALNHRDEFGNTNLTSVIGINQYRDNLGSDSRYRPMKAAGGNAWKHAQLLSIGLQSGSRIKTIVKGQQQFIGKEVNWEIRKQKFGGHEGARGMYPFYFGDHGYAFGADIYQDLIMMAVWYGVIEQAGSWLSYNDGTNNIKIQGKENLAQELYAAGLLSDVQSQVFDKAGIKYLRKGLRE